MRITKTQLAHSNTITKHMLVIDTETTGLIEHGMSIDDAPHCLQIAAVFADTCESYDMHLRIDTSIEIPEMLTKDVHGIDHTVLAELGDSPVVVLRQLTELLKESDGVAFFNAYYDFNILLAAAHRYLILPDAHAFVHALCSIPMYCLMKATTHIKDIGKADNGLYKRKRLIDTYKGIFNKDFSNAHNAQFDAEATAEIYNFLIANKHLREPVRNGICLLHLTNDALHISTINSQNEVVHFCITDTVMNEHGSKLVADIFAVLTSYTSIVTTSNAALRRVTELMRTHSMWLPFNYNTEIYLATRFDVNVDGDSLYSEIEKQLTHKSRDIKPLILGYEAERLYGHDRFTEPYKELMPAWLNYMN